MPNTVHTRNRVNVKELSSLTNDSNSIGAFNSYSNVKSERHHKLKFDNTPRKVVNVGPFFYRGKAIDPDDINSIMKAIGQMKYENDSYTIKKLQTYLHQCK